MPLRLILVRHAKSSWDDPALEDHARPLNGRGRRAATAVGRWLADKGRTPQRVLSSDSARTRETWARITAELPRPSRVDWLPRLYHATPETLMEVLREAGTASPVLVLGHNPGMASAARGFAAAVPDHPKFAPYPTAATTVYEVEIENWSSMAWGAGTVRDFVVPRELEAP